MIRSVCDKIGDKARGVCSEVSVSGFKSRWKNRESSPALVYSNQSSLPIDSPALLSGC